MDQKELVSAFKAVGIKAGDILLIHSSLGSIGKVEGGADTVIDALLKVLGPKGTLLAPVFGALGIIPDKLKVRPGALISPCPVGTLAGLGPAAAALFKDHWKAETVHGRDTPFARLAEKGGKILLLGCDQDRNTFLHGIEAQLELPYLRECTRTFEAEGKTVTKTWPGYPGPHRDFIGIDRRMLESGIMTIGKVGAAQARLIDAKKLLAEGLIWGKEDPAFVLCDNPACPDCVAQRAKIFAATVAKESFTLAMSSRLAGRYVPEMIENLQACGIRYVELDYVQGMPASMMSAEKLAAAAAEFAGAKIGISALRLMSVPADPAELIKALKGAKIKTVLLPGNAKEEAVKAFRKARIAVALYNVCQSGTDLMECATRLKVGTVLSPAAFAAAGEMPFLRSYRNGRFIRHMVQLDVNDALFDGTPVRLAKGNGEIKELVSINRCRNFSGVLTLGGGVIYPATAREMAADFAKLLKEI